MEANNLNKTEDMISLIKNNPDIFPYLEEFNEDINLISQLYQEKIDITKYLTEKLKHNPIIIEHAIMLNPLNIFNFNIEKLTTDQIFSAIEKDNKIIQFLNLSNFQKDKIMKLIENLYEYDYSSIKNDKYFILNKDFMNNALEKSKFNIIYFKGAFSIEEYKSIILDMIKDNYELFRILNNELIEDEDYLIEILKRNPETYTLFPNHKRNSQKIRNYTHFEGVKDIFQYLSYSEKNEDITYNFLKASDSIEKNIVWVDISNYPKLFKDKECLLKLIFSDCVNTSDIENLEWASHEEILSILRSNGTLFDKLSDNLKEDYHYIKAATLESDNCCYNFFDSFNNYPEVVKVVVENNVENYSKIADKYKMNIEWIISYLSPNPVNRFKVILDFTTDFEVLFSLAVKYPQLIELMDKNFSMDKTYVKRIIDENPKSFEFIDYSLKKDIEIVKYAISKDLSNICHISFELYNQSSIINNFFQRIIDGEKFSEDRGFFIYFFEVMDKNFLVKALEKQGNLYRRLDPQCENKEYLIAALKGGFDGYFNPFIRMDSELLYALLKYHPDPIRTINSDFFLAEEDMVIKVLGENSELLDKPFFRDYKITLSFVEKLINIDPENILFIMDKYFFDEEIKDMSLIDKVVIDNPENLTLISKIMEQIEGIYILNKDTIVSILDYYISQKTDKESLYFLYKIPELLREDSSLKIKFEKIFGEKRNFINELLFKVNLMKSTSIYPFVAERFESIIVEDKEKEEEAKQLENLFHLRNFIDKDFLIEYFSNSKIHRKISKKYYANTKDLLETLYFLKSSNYKNFSRDTTTSNKLLEYIEINEVLRENFIIYIGILYLKHFQFKDKDIYKLYEFKNKNDINTFINEKILRSHELKKEEKNLEIFIINSIFIGNLSTSKNEFFDSEFKKLFIDKKSFDIKKWRIYKTLNNEKTLPLQKIINLLFIKNKLSYIDIENFYKIDKTQNEKSKNDLIYRHKKKIQDTINPHLKSLIGWEILIIPEKGKSRRFSLILKK